MGKLGLRAVRELVQAHTFILFQVHGVAFQSLEQRDLLQGTHRVLSILGYSYHTGFSGERLRREMQVGMGARGWVLQLLAFLLASLGLHLPPLGLPTCGHASSPLQGS